MSQLKNFRYIYIYIYIYIYKKTINQLSRNKNIIMIYDRGQRMVIMNSNKLIDKCMSIIGK